MAGSEERKWGEILVAGQSEIDLCVCARNGKEDGSLRCGESCGPIGYLSDEVR